MKAKTTDDYIKAGSDGAIRAGVNKVAIDKVNKEAAKSITKKALAQKVAANKGYSRVTKHVVKNSKAIEKATNSKISTASKLSKFGGGAATVAIDVARGYGEDWAAGKTNSKIASNAAVNAGYALAGIGVSAVATPWITTGLVGAGMAAGPAGWVALAIVGAGWGAWTALTSDKVKEWANSLE